MEMLLLNVSMVCENSLQGLLSSSSSLQLFAMSQAILSSFSTSTTYSGNPGSDISETITGDGDDPGWTVRAGLQDTLLVKLGNIM